MFYVNFKTVLTIPKCNEPRRQQLYTRYLDRFCLALSSEHTCRTQGPQDGKIKCYNHLSQDHFFHKCCRLSRLKCGLLHRHV